MSDIQTSAKKQCPITLLDGGLGTTLVDNFACVFDDSTPLWSSQLLSTDPNTLLRAQIAFGVAGADVIITATYQASFEGFARSGIEEEAAAKAMRSAVGISHSAFPKNNDIKPRGKTALSLGAYGATMIPSQEYSGNYDADHVTVEQLREWHCRRLDVFLPSAGHKEEYVGWEAVDMVAFETLPRIEEIWAARKVMQFVDIKHPQIPAGNRKDFWISCVFPGAHNILPDGSTVRDTVQAMLKPRDGAKIPTAIGLNCTRVGKVESIILEFEEAVAEMVQQGETEWPALVVYPDGTMGEVYNTTTKVWEKQEGYESVGTWDETIFGIVKRAKTRGLWSGILVGGCCKTGPAEIAKLRKCIDGL